MILFKRRVKHDRQPADWLVQLRGMIDKRQRKIADFLVCRTQYWNKLSWIIALTLFILLFGGCCLLLCIKAFIH